MDSARETTGQGRASGTRLACAKKHFRKKAHLDLLQKDTLFAFHIWDRGNILHRRRCASCTIDYKLTDYQSNQLMNNLLLAASPALGVGGPSQIPSIAVSCMC